MKKQQVFVIPFVIFGVCLFAFGIPFVFSMGIDDSHRDVVLQPRFTPTPTPLDRLLTQQAFANLFFSPTSPPIFAESAVSTPTDALVAILITGPTSTLTFTPFPTPSPSKTPIPLSPTSTHPPEKNAPSQPTRPAPSTNTAVVVQPHTGTPSLPDPPTDTPEPPPTDPPPTDPPPTDPPPTDPPLPTDPPPPNP